MPSSILSAIMLDNANNKGASVFDYNRSYISYYMACSNLNECILYT